MNNIHRTISKNKMSVVTSPHCTLLQQSHDMNKILPAVYV